MVKCLQEVNESIEFAEKVLKLKPTSFEAYYARAKALKDLRCVMEYQNRDDENIYL